MSTKKHSFERRTDKLRASCDACYLAKVKCSKSRPLCQRCLVSGTNCAYSPSARFKRGPKTSGGDRVDEDTVAFRIQKNSEANIEFNPSTIQLQQPSYQYQSSLNIDEQYTTPDSTPCTGNWTPDLLMCHEPVFLVDGEAGSELYTDVGGFGLPDQCSWWNNTSTMPNSAVDSGFDGSCIQLEHPEAALSYCYSYQCSRSGPSHPSSSGLDMIYTQLPGAGTACDLDYGPFNTTGNFSNLQHQQLTEHSNPLHYGSQGQ